FLCEPFYRVDRSRTRESGGMGLGLYICRNIADVHGWTLAVTSREAHYTTVTVSGIDVYKK
ncbi:MAG: ATP-binding protein, partial [Spirochaetota bacterium]